MYKKIYTNMELNNQHQQHNVHREQQSAEQHHTAALFTQRHGEVHLRAEHGEKQVDHDLAQLVVPVQALGLAGQGQDYWALAIRGEGLSVRQVQAQDCEDRPEEQLDYALAAFALGDVTYQVPDLPALQQRAQDVAA